MFSSYKCFEEKKQPFSTPSFLYRLSDFSKLKTILSLCFCTLYMGMQAQSYTVEPNKANANYALGENVVFVINSSISTTAEYEIMVDKHTAPLKSGTLTLQADGVSTISFSSNEPVSVICRVRANGTQQFASAAIAPFGLQPIEDEPARFDAFWEEARTELANIPIDPKLTFHSESEYATTYRINVATIDQRRVYGYISVPKMEGPYSGVLSLPAYGSIANVVTPTIYLAEQAGVLAFAISIHNTEPDVVDSNAYKPNNIMNEYTNYYRYAVLACIRAIDYLFSRSDFNGELAVTGVSQGGGLALMTAGLDERVDLLMYSNASHCEHAGKKYEKASGFPYYLNQARLMYNINEEEEEQIVQACKYYDANYFARRYDGPSLGFISYLDDVSPPTTTFAAFNQLQGMKVLMHGKKLKHEHPQEYWVGRYDALRRFLPGSNRAPWPYARKTQGYLLDIGENQIIMRGESISLTPSFLKNEETPNLPSEWIQLEGPGTASFNNPNAMNTSVSFSEAGVYRLQLRLLDEDLLADKAKFYTISDEITVIVQEGNAAPLVIECVDDITIYSSTSSEVVSWDAPTAISACGTASVMQTNGPTSGSNFPIGRTRVEYIITDDCGNTESCEFHVTVLKETFTPLVVNCPEDIILYTDNTSTIGNWELPSIVTACNTNPTAYTQTEGLPLGSSFPLGDTRISYRITDACGQEATCSFTVMVIQSFEPLEIACPADILLSTNDESAIATWELPEILSACNNEAVQYTQTEGLPLNSAFPVGDTRVSYRIEDACGQEANCAFIVTVTQNLKPLEIACPADIMITTTDDSAIATWELPEVLSACNNETVQFTQTAGTPSGSAFPVGETTISYEVTDACEQVRSCSFTVTVTQELELLVISCPKDTTIFTTTDNAIPNWELPEVLSACMDEGIQISQQAGPPLGNPFPLGSTEVSYEVTDACGQVQTCTFIITVEQQEILPLVIECPEDISVTTTTGDALLTWGLPQIVSACDEGGLQFIQTEGLPSGSVFQLGETIISYEVMDACGQVAYCSFSVEVLDANPPTLNISCPFNIILQTYRQDTTVTWELPTILSACNEGEITYTQVLGPTRGGVFPIGETRVTYKVEDSCGQVRYCSFLVTIIRNEGETLAIECPTNVAATLLNGHESMSVNWDLPQVNSVCEGEVIISKIQGPANGTWLSVGSYTVTYLAQDACGNRAICSFQVEVTTRKENEVDIDTFSSNDDAIHAYPNPTKDWLSLEWENPTTEALTIELINALGQIVYQNTFPADKGTNNIQVPMQHLSSGWYVCRLKNIGTWVKTKPVLKQ